MAQNMNYPGVYRREVDDTAYSTVDNSTYVAVMGRALKGPINQRVLVKSETELINTFGNPLVSGTYPTISAVDYGIYAGIEALKETSNLWFVRLADGAGGEKYANLEVLGTSGLGTSASIASATSWASSTSITASSATNGGDSPTYIQSLRGAVTSGAFRVGSIGPGTYGNNIAIMIETAYGNYKAGTTGALSTTSGSVALSAISASACAWGSYFDADPSIANATWRNVIRLSIYQKDDSQVFDTTFWANNGNAPVESYFCTTKEGVIDAAGNSLFIEDVINGVSKYIYVTAKDLLGTLPTYSTTAIPLKNGSDSFSSIAPAAKTAWVDLFGNRDIAPLDIAVVVPRAINTKTEFNEASEVNGLLSKRLDFIAIIQASSVASVNVGTITADNTDYAQLTNSSYFAKYVGWNLVYDRYNACKLWIPNAIYAASTMAYTDRVLNSWVAPAGQDVGGIPSGRQNVDIDPTLGGQLYDMNLNTIKFVRGVGSVIWGQKTAQLQKTARDRINVRRLLLTIEKNVEGIANGFMFKGNTVKLREKATALINSYLSTVKVAGGVEQFKVVCDGSNNTQSSIDANILNIGVYVKPVRTIEYILITTTVTNNGVVFGEG